MEATSPSNAVEVAGWIGPRLHPFGQDVGAVIPTGFDAYARLDHAPLTGVLREAAVLAGVVARHTTTPDVCWFCLWEGYGYLHPGGSSAWLTAEEKPPRPSLGRRLRIRWPRKPVRHHPDRLRVTLPNRDYLLFTGSVAQAAGWPDGPNLWWPDDRAWFVASEIDLPCTYVGGRKELIAALLSEPALEGLPATSEDELA